MNFLTDKETEKKAFLMIRKVKESQYLPGSMGIHLASGFYRLDLRNALLKRIYLKSKHFFEDIDRAANVKIFIVRFFILPVKRYCSKSYI